MPEDPNLYFHRIGRTARAGGEGKAISLVSNDRISDFKRILAQTKLPIRKLNDELGVVVQVIAQRQASFGRGGGYRWHGGYGSRSSYRNERGGGERRYGEEEEVPVAIEAAGARADMVATEGAVAMVTTADTVAAATTATTTI